jgi:hypothetical protein
MDQYLLVFGNNHSNVVSHCPWLNGWLGGDLSLVLAIDKDMFLGAAANVLQPPS